MKSITFLVMCVTISYAALAQWSGGTTTTANLWREGNIAIGGSGSTNPAPPYAALFIGNSTVSHPSIVFRHSGAAANEKEWEFIVQPNDFKILTTNDDVSASVTALSIARTGVNISRVSFPSSNVTIGSDVLHGSYGANERILQIKGEGTWLNMISTAGTGSSFNIGNSIGLGTAFMSWDSPFSFRTGSSSNGSMVERMKILLNGYIGMGTSLPLSKLHINSTVERETLRIYKDGNTTNYLSIWQGTGGAAIDPIGTGKLWLGYDQPTDVYMNVGGGKVGIGTDAPTSKLQVVGGEIALDADQPIRGGGRWLISGNSSMVTVGTTNPGVGLRFDAGSSNRMFINGTTGNIGIGTNTPDERLSIKGKVHSEEVVIDLSVPGPDYVFEEDYALRTLEETENYIKHNKHLPEVPSAKEMEQSGLIVGEMNMLLLKKVEELTLYVIEQNKKIAELQSEVEKLKK